MVFAAHAHGRRDHVWTFLRAQERRYIAEPVSLPLCHMNAFAWRTPNPEPKQGFIAHVGKALTLGNRGRAIYRDLFGVGLKPRKAAGRFDHPEIRDRFAEVHGIMADD